MTPTDFIKAFKQETMQAFVVVVAALWIMAERNVDPDVIRYTAWAGLCFIAGEKLRSAIVGAVKAWRRPDA